MIRWSLFALPCFLGFVLFWVWHRRPAGRGFASSPRRTPRGLREFDSCNPNAPAAARDAFYIAVQAQLSGDRVTARVAYARVLSYLPDEQTTNFNLGLM